MDPSLGWNGITKATPLKQFPAEEPNRTNPDEVISKLRDNDPTLEKVNLNNVPVKEDQVFVFCFHKLTESWFLEKINLNNVLVTENQIGKDDLSLINVTSFSSFLYCRI